MMAAAPVMFAPNVFTPTPCAATPGIFKVDGCPWATRTPETSPMCWGRTPPAEASQDFAPNSTELAPLSREMLRAVCEPFVEQMITALQSALLQQQWWTQTTDLRPQQNIPGTTTAHMNPCSLPLSTPAQHKCSSGFPVVLEESSETDDCGAFASLFSSLSSDDNGSDVPEGHMLMSEPVNHLPAGDVALAAEADKSVMVCRHWKSKGFCRLEAKCKFQHPDEKRGTKAPKAPVKTAKSETGPKGVKLETDKQLLACEADSAALGANPAVGNGGACKKPRRKSLRELKELEMGATVFGTQELPEQKHGDDQLPWNGRPAISFGQPYV